MSSRQAKALSMILRVGSPGCIYQGIPVREPAILRRLEYRQAAFLRFARNGRQVGIGKLRKMAQERTEQPVLFLYESKHFTLAAYSGFQGLGKEHPVFFNDSIGTAFICRDGIQWFENGSASAADCISSVSCRYWEVCSLMSNTSAKFLASPKPDG